MLQWLLSVTLLASVVSGQQASINLSGTGPGTCMVRNTNGWDVAKNVESSTTSSVRFVITTDHGSTDLVPTLTVAGSLSITNGGGGAASIGNIVFNLQRKAKTGSTWQMVCSNIADSTNGDDATTANVVKAATEASNCATPATTPYAQGGQQTYTSSSGICKLSERAGCSGPIEFRTLAGNTIFSMVPSFTIAPGQTVDLIYTTSFLNPEQVTGGDFKLEILVTFANAGNRGSGGASSTVPVDVNGNGYIDNVAGGGDYPEKYVRSVPIRIGKLTIPAVQDCNKCVHLVDKQEDVTVTDSAQFTGFVTDIASSGDETLCTTDGTQGKVTRHVDVSGVSGTGDVLNCASLQGASTSITWVSGTDLFGQPIIQSVPCCVGVDADDCAYQHFAQIASPPPPEAPLACGYTQGAWAANPAGNNAAKLLSNTFSAVFPAGVEIGYPSLYTILWTSAQKIADFTPGGGTAAALTTDLVNPTSTNAGVFTGHVLAAFLNIAYSDYAFSLSVTDPNHALVVLKFANPIEDLGGLLYCPGTASPLAGLTINEIMVIANTLLGGGSVPGFTIAQVDPVVNQINEEWDNCTGPNTGVFLIAETCP